MHPRHTYGCHGLFFHRIERCFKQHAEQRQSDQQDLFPEIDRTDRHRCRASRRRRSTSATFSWARIIMKLLLYLGQASHFPCAWSRMETAGREIWRAQAFEHREPIFPYWMRCRLRRFTCGPARINDGSYLIAKCPQASLRDSIGSGPHPSNRNNEQHIRYC